MMSESKNEKVMLKKQVYFFETDQEVVSVAVAAIVAERGARGGECVVVETSGRRTVANHTRAHGETADIG